MAYAGINDWYNVYERAEALRAKGIYASMLCTILPHICTNSSKHKTNVITEVFDESFWEYSVLKQLFTESDTWTDQFGVQFSPTIDHPCMFSFGESLVWNKNDNQWQWIHHPQDLYVWKFTDLRQTPCIIDIYHTARLQQFQQKTLETQRHIATNKEDRGFVGWKKSTLEAIQQLSELSPRKEAEALMTYYTQCGLAEDYQPQLTHLAGVTTQNLFIQYERRHLCQQVVLGNRTETALPKRINRHTVRCM